MISTSPHIEVLLAAFNGERYIAAQIDSILRQTYPALHILARDDGSTDDTARLLQEYATQQPARVHIAPGSGTSSGGGAKTNFVRLMEHASAEYFAFSDQDDVWLPDKLTRSMNAMQALVARHGVDEPLLVFSDLRVVNEDLSARAPSFWAQQGIRPERIHSLPHLLTQNVVTGCTMLCNRALLNRSLPIPAKAFMHDRWMALVACIFGYSHIVREPTVLYRQHGSNVVGAGTRRKGLPRLLDDTRRRMQWAITEAMAQAVLERFGETLPAYAKEVCENFVQVRDSRYGIERSLAMLRGRYLSTSISNNMDMLWYLTRSASRRKTS